jgi:hypothetical protein
MRCGTARITKAARGSGPGALRGVRRAVKTMITVPGGKRKSRAARKAARAALEDNGGSSATGGNQAPPAERPRQCPVFGCTREHTPGNCPTFLDMAPKERLDMVHAKQLCLLCLQHPLSVGCEVASRGTCCPAKGCDRPHHVTLREDLKAGKSSLLEGNTDPPDEPVVAAACGIPEMAKQLRGLLEGLGIDPGALEVRIGVREPGEPGRPCGGETTDPDAAGAGVGRLTSRLMKALTSLCQAGEMFVDSAAGEECLQRPKQIGGQEHGARAQEGQQLDGASRARHSGWGGWR